MNNILRKNLEVVKNKHPEITINNLLVEEYDKAETLKEIESYNGYMIKSRVNQSLAINVWCEQFEELKQNEVAIIFGIGNLDYYCQLKKKYPELVIVAYEPCEEIFYNCIAHKDYIEILEADNILFCMGEKIHDSLLKAIGMVLGPESINKPFFAIIPNYHKIFEEEYEIFEKTVKAKAKANLASKNTVIVYEEERIDNYLENLKQICYESTVNELVAKFKDCDLSGYPAIILAAGPSLDKNIKKLKDIKGKAFVIAVDAAVNTAAKNNIRPDLIISVDPIMYEDSLKDDIGRELPLILHMNGSITIRNINRGRKFFISDNDYYLNKTLEVCNKGMAMLETGGSVANSAFSLVRRMGFETIILMGQDLGFPGNKQHAEDAFADEDDVVEDDDMYFYVESIDGGKVLTSHQMDIYKEWFSNEIKLYPELNVIDATEGGALIEGTKILTIDEAIKRYCPKEGRDFEGMINDADYLLNDDNRDMIKGIINKTFDDIDYNIDYLNKAKRDYYKLRELNEKRKYSSSEFKRITKKVGEHNRYLEENKDFILYKKCCTQRHFECIDALKTIYDNEYDEIKNLVKQSLIMLDEYIRAGNILKEKWNQLKDDKENN